MLSQSAGGSDAPSYSQGFFPKSLYAWMSGMVWAATPRGRGSSPQRRVWVPLWCQESHRSPLGTRPAVHLPKGTLTALTLKSNFGQAQSSSIVHKPDIYVSEILPLQDAPLFMILSNKMPLRLPPTSFSFPDVL